jgi:hypothetical protein
VGNIHLSAGAFAVEPFVYVNMTAPLVPSAVVAVTLTAPAAWAGVVAAICVPVPLTTTFVAGEPPKDTEAPARFVPVKVTDVPPAVVPDVGVIPVSVGAEACGATCVNVTAPLVPAAVVAVTLAGPAAWAGILAVIRVPAPLTTTFVAAEPPKDTEAPARFVPVKVTDVPPRVVPEVGTISVKVGGEGCGAI